MGRRKRNATYEETSFDFLFTFLTLILSALVACGTYIFCYRFLQDAFRSLILQVALTFLVFTLVLLMLMMLLSIVTGRFKENVFTGRNSPGIVALIILGVSVGVMFLAGLFQLIYQTNFVKDTDAYVFMVDISESMDWNDPNGKRYDAIEDLIDDRGDRFPYMVYTFNHESSVLRKMAANEEEYGFSPPRVNSGGTQIFNALNRVVEDYNDGDWKNASKPQIILITDAEKDKSTMTEDSAIEACRKAGVPVSTIFLGGGNMTTLMNVSNETGGTYVQIRNADELDNAMTLAAGSRRSMLENRETGSGIYSVLRILFLTLLGWAIGFGGLMAYGRHEAGLLILISAPIKALVASGLYEVFMELLPNRINIRLKELFVILLLTLLGTQLLAMAQGRQYDETGIYRVKDRRSSAPKKGKNGSSSPENYDFLFN